MTATADPTTLPPDAQRVLAAALWFAERRLRPSLPHLAARAGLRLATVAHWRRELERLSLWPTMAPPRNTGREMGRPDPARIRDVAIAIRAEHEAARRAATRIVDGPYGTVTDEVRREYRAATRRLGMGKKGTDRENPTANLPRHRRRAQ